MYRSVVDMVRSVVKALELHGQYPPFIKQCHWGELAEALSQCSPVSARGKSHCFLSSHSLSGALTACMLLDISVPKLAASLVKVLVCVLVFRHLFL